MATLNLWAKLLLLLLAIIFMFWQYLTVSHQLDDRDEISAWRKTLLSPAFIITLSLAMNGMAVLQSIYVAHSITIQDSSSPLLEFLRLIQRQASVTLGTVAMYEIVRRALISPLGDDDTLHTAGLRFQIRMYRNLFKQHLFAVLGIGTVLGVVGGPGLALFLGGELALMWLGTTLFLQLAVKRQKET